jgi:hypothetical protein
VVKNQDGNNAAYTGTTAGRNKVKTIGSGNDNQQQTNASKLNVVHRNSVGTLAK